MNPENKIGPGKSRPNKIRFKVTSQDWKKKPTTALKTNEAHVPVYFHLHTEALFKSTTLRQTSGSSGIPTRPLVFHSRVIFSKHATVKMFFNYLIVRWFLKKIHLGHFSGNAARSYPIDQSCSGGTRQDVLQVQVQFETMLKWFKNSRSLQLYKPTTAEEPHQVPLNGSQAQESAATMRTKSQLGEKTFAWLTGSSWGVSAWFYTLPCCSVIGWFGWRNRDTPNNPHPRVSSI